MKTVTAESKGKVTDREAIRRVWLRVCADELRST